MFMSWNFSWSTDYLTILSLFSLQAAAHAARPAAASAPLAVCAKGRPVTPAAVSEESAASAVYWPCDDPCVNHFKLVASVLQKMYFVLVFNVEINLFPC